MTAQNKYLLAFLAFSVTFLGSFGMFLVGHSTVFHNAEMWGHVALITASALGAMGAALKYQIPRSSGDYSDRVSDQKRVDINQNGSER